MATSVWSSSRNAFSGHEFGRDRLTQDATLITLCRAKHTSEHAKGSGSPPGPFCFADYCRGVRHTVIRRATIEGVRNAYHRNREVV